jgi:hypothetical protein
MFYKISRESERLFPRKKTFLEKKDQKSFFIIFFLTFYFYFATYNNMQQAKCKKVTHRYHSVDALNFLSLSKEVSGPRDHCQEIPMTGVRTQGRILGMHFPQVKGTRIYFRLTRPPSGVQFCFLISNVLGVGTR